MLLTISTTHRPATDLGYLLHKHPARLQTFSLAFGKAHVFYPEADEERCTAALLLDLDPVALVRGRGKGRGGLLTDYVNDRPYVASSFLSVAISRVFGSALGGRSKERPELAEQPLPLSAKVAALPCRGGEAGLRRLFEPLGYAVSVDEPGEGEAPSRYRTLRLEGRKPLAELLAHLYVLIPVLDNDKHYWVGDAEVDKLVSRGAGWLAAHPEREFIAKRYLKYRTSLAGEALARLDDEGDLAPAPGISEALESAGLAAVAAADPSGDRSASARSKAVRPEPLARLNDIRMAAVAEALRESGARRVLDLGCGEGRLLRELLPMRQFTELVGVDASPLMLEIAARRLKLERLPPKQQERLTLLHGSLVYRDKRLAGYDAAAVVEVIEHLEPDRLAAFEAALFGCARPATVVLTTPNREYNLNFLGLPEGKFRHADHRFEWNRAEFADWANGLAARHGYEVRLQPVGGMDPERGPPTQMAVFQKCK